MYRSPKDRKYRKVLSSYHTSKHPGCAEQKSPRYREDLAVLEASSAYFYSKKGSFTSPMLEAANAKFFSSNFNGRPAYYQVFSKNQFRHREYLLCNLERRNARQGGSTTKNKKTAMHRELNTVHKSYYAYYYETDPCMCDECVYGQDEDWCAALEYYYENHGDGGDYEDWCAALEYYYENYGDPEHYEEYNQKVRDMEFEFSDPYYD
jgi:hypothetical protein